MSNVPAKVFLHVGTRKSGTTSLQQALQDSEAALAAQGVHLLYPDRDVVRRELMSPLRSLRDGGDARVAEAAARALREQVESHEAPVHLLSVETLAEMPRAVTDLVVGELADFEVHVVITARHWGLTVPSEWQQGIKSRWEVSYADFVASIRDRDADAAPFLARQDVADIVDRWGALLPPDRVHVIACPPRSRTTGTLVDLFCGVVGIDPSTLVMAETSYNTSLSLTQAELLRLVNVALGKRLPLGRGGYQAGVRRWIVRRTMGRQEERSSILLPEGYAPWAADESRAQLDAIRERGVDLVGRPEDLLAAPDAPSGPVGVDESDLLETAVETIADLADRHLADVDRYERKIARLQAERDRLRARAPGGKAPGRKAPKRQGRA